MVLTLQGFDKPYQRFEMMMVVDFAPDHDGEAGIERKAEEFPTFVINI